MDKQILNRFEENGLPCPFVVTRTGETAVTDKNAELKSKISQMGTVIYESIDAVGRIKIESIEIIGETKSLILKVDEEKMAGSLLDRAAMRSAEETLALIKEMEAGLQTLPQAPEVKVRAGFSAAFLDELKAILKEYVGDFTDRIYQNQFKAQRLNPDELSEEDVRRFILALGKAAGMIIGPSKGRELINKMLAKVK